MVLSSLANHVVQDAKQHDIKQIKIGNWTTPQTLSNLKNKLVLISESIELFKITILYRNSLIFFHINHNMKE